MNRIYILIAISLLLASKARALADPQIQLNIVPDHQTIVFGQPISVNLVLISSDASTVDLGANSLGNLSLSITDPTGKTEVRGFTIPDFSAPGIINLHVGDRYSKRINISAAYQPEQIGDYIIRVSVLQQVTNSLANGKPVMVTVLPKDANRLSDVSKALAKQIVNSDSADERLELASELSLIRDPVVLPAIKSLLHKGLAIDDMLLRSLGSIYVEDSVRILREELSGPDEVLALVSRSALTRIVNGSTNRQVRELASAALKNSEPPTN